MFSTSVRYRLRLYYRGVCHALVFGAARHDVQLSSKKIHISGGDEGLKLKEVETGVFF